LKSENEAQIEQFLDRTSNAKMLSDWHQIFPGQNGMDGFFYAPLKKVAQ